MSRRKQAVPARRTEFAGEGQGEGENSSSADGQITGDNQAVRMDHGSRATRSNSSSSQQTNGKLKGPELSSPPREGGRPGLRRTQRKNAHQRYKLGKIAAAESNKMIGAELRSERRRSTEAAPKGKVASDKKSKGTVKAILEISSKIGIRGDSPGPKKVVPSLNGTCEDQEDDLSKPAIAEVKSDPGLNHQAPKRPLTDSDPQPLNLTASLDKSDCGDPKETNDAPVNVPQDEDGNSSGSSIPPHKLSTGQVHDMIHAPGAPTPAEEIPVHDESSVLQSDIPNGERTPSPTTDTNCNMVAENGDGSGGKDPKNHPDAPNSDDGCADLSEKNNNFKRRRPMEEGNTSLTCPVCSENFENKHLLTLHFRDHKTTTSDGTMHSCKLCGKKLSSTSSLDRHMLIHSGERPHRCPICPMTFTTNGNMRRHVRTHKKGGSDGIHSDGSYVNDMLYGKARKRILSKRVIVSEDGESDILNPKRPALESKYSPTKLKAKEDELACPICSKTFLCHIGLQTHMELHPNVVMKCSQCEATFKNHRGLRMHVVMSHKKSNSPNKPQSGSSEVPLGFQDLGYVADISCDKFPLIAQEWCEQNVRRCNSVIHQFVCQMCSKAFPCASALDLHKTKNHSLNAESLDLNLTNENDVIQTEKENHLSSEDEQARENKNRCYNQLRKAFPTQKQFMAKLFLRPNPSPSPEIPLNPKPELIASSRSKAPTYQISDEVQADRDFADVGKILTLTTSASSNPLLMLKHFGRGGKHSPGKHSPTKGKGAGITSLKPPMAHSHFHGQHEAHIRQTEPEPKSGDPATEMHFPTEFARDERRIEQATTAYEETSSDAGIDSELTDSGKTNEASDEDKDNRKLGKYVCKYCQESFPQYSTLKIHLRTHMGLTPFKCLLCDYSSADKSTLVRHMRTHSGERPYSCKICDFPFTTKANCERHIKKRHGKVSKLDIEISIIHTSGANAVGESSSGKFRSPETFCKFCNREFRFFRDLQNHLKVHQRTPRKPFFCLKCQTGFSSKNNCSRHVNKCHPEITKEDVANYMMVRYMEVPDISQVMANSFASNGEQLSPIDFSKKSPLATVDCDLSDQSWLNAYSLPNLTDLDAPIDLSLPKGKSSNSFLPPVESSLGRLRFKRVYHKFYSKTIDALVCPHCSQSYTRGSVFKEHIRSHTMERPHRCYYCKAAFTIRDSLDKHIERRHSEESKSESPAQSFIPKIATPMQFKLMSRSSQGLRVRISFDAATEATDDLLDQPAIDENKAMRLQSPGSSFGSDASGELASVSKILAASSNNFQVCFPPAGVHVKQEVDSEEEVNDRAAPSLKEDFPEAEKMRDRPPTTSNWAEPSTPEVDLAEEYDLVIDESLASTSDTGDTVEPTKTKERDRCNLPSKETCPYCHRKFPWISSLRRHILTHTGLKPFQCPQCNSSFSTKSNCERHIVRRHCLSVSPGAKVPENPFACFEGCPDATYSTKLKLLKHYEIQHACIPFPDCYKNEVKKLPAHIIRNALAKRAHKLSRSFGSSEFRSRVGMSGVTLKFTRHKQLMNRRHLPIDDKLLADKPLALIKKPTSVSESDSKSSKNHLKKLHPAPVKGKPFPIVFKKKKTKPSSSMTNNITISPTSADQTADANATSDPGTSYNKNSPTSPSLKYAPDGASTKPTNVKSKSKRKHAHHSCNQCCKRFKSATTLKRHYRVHTLEHPFRCPDCSASFTTKFNCQRHMLKLHGKSKEEIQSILEKQRVEATGGGHSSMDGANSVQDPGSSNSDHIIIPNPGDASTGDTLEEDVLDDVNQKSPATDQEDNNNKENVSCENLNNDENNLDDLEEFADDNILGGLEDPDLPNSSINETNVDDTMDFAPTWHQKSPTSKVRNPTKKQESHVGTTMGLSRDVFVSGQTDDSDMIQNLLGIQDSSVLDQMLDSADSAAKLLGME